MHAIATHRHASYRYVRVYTYFYGERAELIENHITFSVIVIGTIEQTFIFKYSKQDIKSNHKERMKREMTFDS